MMGTAANRLVAKAIQHREDVWYGLIAFFMITLYIPHIAAINSITIGLIVLFSFCMNPLQEKWQLLKSRIYIQLMIALFIEHLISAVLSVDKHAASLLLATRTPLLLFPVAVGLTGITETFKRKILVTFAVVTTAAALLFVVLFAIYPWMGVNGILTQYIDKQNNYFGSMILIAISCYAYAVMQPGLQRITGFMMSAAMVFLSVVLFVMASRMPIIAFCTAMFLLVALLVLKYRKIKWALTITGVLALEILLLCVVFSETKGRFGEVNNAVADMAAGGSFKSDPGNVYDGRWNSATVRTAIWQSDWQLSKKHFFTGSHLGDKMAGLLNVYKENNFNIDFNAHNTYLDVLMTFGLVGFLLFVLGYFIVPLRASLLAQDWPAFFMLVAISIVLITESYLDRSVGCILLGFFIPLVSGRKQPPLPSKMKHVFQFERVQHGFFAYPIEEKKA